MVEKADRSAVGDEPRGDPGRQWEVFVREDPEDPLRHVGSVAAPEASVAREQASKLFAWYAEDLWLCPAEEVRRFSTHSLEPSTEEGQAAPREPDAPEDGAVVDEDATSDHDGDDEPRVTEL